MGSSPSVMGSTKTAGVELGEGKGEGLMMIRALDGVTDGLRVGLGLSPRLEGVDEKEGNRKGAADGVLVAGWVITMTGTGVTEGVFVEVLKGVGTKEGELVAVVNVSGVTVVVGVGVGA